MAKIPVRKYGEVVAVALVDDEDYERINRHRWTLMKWGYARRGGYAEGRNRAVLMHREVMGATKGDGIEVRHRNGDRLDNRRSNLLVLSPSTVRPQSAHSKTG